MRTTLHSRPTSIVFLPGEAGCRCGQPDLGETCPACGQGVCAHCALFIDPATRQPTRPSLLISRQPSTGFLAHRVCLPVTTTPEMACVRPKDVSLIVRIVKGPKALGRLIEPAAAESRETVRA